MSSEEFQHIRWFRDSAPYINAHRGRTFVIVFGGEAALHSNFANIIHDIALLHSLGVRLLLIHGARPQIARRMSAAGFEGRFHDGVRITDTTELAYVKDACGSLRTDIEALLSTGLPNSPMQGASITVTGGNFITAQPLGVVDGVDFQHTGRVRRVDDRAIRQQLDAGCIVLLSPLGYSPTGEIFNLSLEDISVRTAAAVGAEKLLLFGAGRGIQDGDELVRQCNLTQALDLLRGALEPEQRRLLQTARQACTAGVKRCQIVSYAEDGALLQELFTHDGSGTLVGPDEYEQARTASIEDVGGILELIEPLEREGVLVKRSREVLETEIDRFRVLERDGRIIACAALYPFTEHGSGELACIVTHPDYRGGDRGARLLRELEQAAARQGLSQVFVLTTRTAHWFLEQGFEESTLAALPQERQSLYNLQRSSKVFSKKLSIKPL
ncbi:MAG: amino-acid N-acetyltransferase [Halieaceae bacterium]|jgi:amino-acid N-acetyltransferase|nr:amino-acid N-acetyltransferase [Halieaceae bacterium]